MELTLEQVAQAIQAKLFNANDIHACRGAVAAPLRCTGVSTDTRQLKSGDLFFCLIGIRDGHAFAKEALQKGAVAIVIDQAHQYLVDQLQQPCLVVPDTLRALGDLAHHWRKQFNIPVVAITGSNGKTTTKNLCATVVATQYRCLATDGNFNNLIGMPLTLFRLNNSHQVAIIEMGMNDFGEIARLAEIAAPTIALITNVGPAHLEKLESVEGVAKAKGELFAAMGPHHLAIVNVDDPHVSKLPTRASKFTFGVTTKAQLMADQVVACADGTEMKIKYQQETFNLKLKLVGSHNAYNALAALALCIPLHINMQNACKALAAYEGRDHRLELIPLKNGLQLIDDCYNANPLSMEKALQTLHDIKGKKRALVILGEMFELGQHTELEHQLLGKCVAFFQMDGFWAVGPFAELMTQAAMQAGMAMTQVFASKDPEAGFDKLKLWLEQVDYVLVKGSRGAHLERVVDYIKGLCN